MLTIPLQAVPSQIVNVQLGGQNCTIKVYQQSTGLYCDLYVDNTLVIGGVICQNENRIVRDAYLGFVGDLGFIDNSGAGLDPVFTGLGSTFSFVYLEATDLKVGA